MACLLAGLFLVGCAADKDVPSEGISRKPVDLLIGVWLKPIDGTNGFDGFQFDANGKVHFLNMFTITGDSWLRMSETRVAISSHTDRYSEPETDHHIIKELTDEKLVLVPEDFPEGKGIVYRRASAKRPADRMVGRWTPNEERFFDVTPLGDEYRIVGKNKDDIEVMVGRATPEGMMVEAPDRNLSIVLVAGKETGREDWQGKVDCVCIEGVFYLCR